MNLFWLDDRRLRRILILCFITGAWFSMFPLPHPFFQWWANQSLWIAVGYLILGLFFLIVNRFRLMFICLSCSAAISFYKNEKIIHDGREKLQGGRAPTEWVAIKMS